MYYKIENKDCDVYKSLHALRTDELRMEEDNRKKIDEKTGLTYQHMYGHRGQSGMNRVTDFVGFAFHETDKVCLKTWKEHKEHKGLYVPNAKTKQGREMKHFLSYELEKSVYKRLLDVLNIKNQSGRFQIPYMEIFGETIVLRLDDDHALFDENVVEITQREAIEIYKSVENQQDNEKT